MNPLQPSETFRLLSNQDIDKEDKDSFAIRAYDDAEAKLDLLDEDFIRDLLYSNFSGGDDDQLEGTAGNTS